MSRQEGVKTGDPDIPYTPDNKNKEGNNEMKGKERKTESWGPYEHVEPRTPDRRKGEETKQKTGSRMSM